MVLVCIGSPAQAQIGLESSSYERLEDGEEHILSLGELLRRGEAAFRAEWTPREGGGRPFSKGAGVAPLTDPGEPLIFPRNFNRISARDANSCFGCHNAPNAIAGGGGDFVAGVFVGAQRFDFATFDHADSWPKKGAIDESGAFVNFRSIGNYRASIGMFGAGFIEMLARQMTEDLRSLRDATPPGASVLLTSKGVTFGTLRRWPSGAWDVSQVEGLPAQSLRTTSPPDPPSLVIRPFHQSGSAVSLREFTNNAFNHHHGMQSVERFGDGTDPDGDGVFDELTRADITAVTVFQATLPVPTQVMPRDPALRAAVEKGEALFNAIGCTDCHIPALPLVDDGWIYTEPNPFNPPGNLQREEARQLSVDLTHAALPGRRLRPRNDVVWVPAFTDLKLHDITSGAGDPNEESLDINQPAGSRGFREGNRKFLTKKLWGAANERPYFHHGLFTTLREATLAHDGEALGERRNFAALAIYEQDLIIEFLKSLQVSLYGSGDERQRPGGAAFPVTLEEAAKNVRRATQ